MNKLMITFLLVAFINLGGHNGNKHYKFRDGLRHCYILDGGSEGQSISCTM